MSITDTSTALDLVWTEGSAVAFTAGTLAGVAECVTEVESKLRRGTLGASTTPTSTEVQRWLIRAKQELMEVKGFTWARRYATATTTAGTYRYALPPDYNGGALGIRDTSNDRILDVWPEYIFDTRYPDMAAQSQDEPQIATIKNRELWLAPPPGGAYTLEIEYERSGDDNTATDFSYLPQIDRFRCCDFACAEAFASLHMWQESQYYWQRWSQAVGLAKKSDARRKWRRMEYQAISWLQQDRAKSIGEA